MEKVYKKRIADGLLQRKLAGKGAVLIEGAKWCGKTTTAEQIAKSILYMSETGMVEQNVRLASLNPKLLLRGENPRLIDEWQIAPQLWDSVRFESDHGPLGQFILTGSSVPADMSSCILSESPIPSFNSAPAVVTIFTAPVAYTLVPDVTTNSKNSKPAITTLRFMTHTFLLLTVILYISYSLP